MPPTWMIEEIEKARREREERERPRLWIEAPCPERDGDPPEPETGERRRGVVTIDVL